MNKKRDRTERVKVKKDKRSKIRQKSGKLRDFKEVELTE